MAGIALTSGGKTETVKINLGGFDLALVEAEGWIGYAEKHY